MRLLASLLVVLAMGCSTKVEPGQPPPAASLAKAAPGARGVTIRGMTSAERAAIPLPPGETLPKQGTKPH